MLVPILLTAMVAVLVSLGLLLRRRTRVDDGVGPGGHAEAASGPRHRTGLYWA